MKQRQDHLQVLGEIGNIQEDTGNLRWSRFHHAVYTGDLIPGCRLCKRRAWCHIHIGLACNLQCAFCPLETGGMVLPERDDGVRERDMEALYAQNAQRPVEGVSFSGGEPLLYLEQVEEYADTLLKLNPQMHIWLYTNGTLATRENLERLRRAGIQEVRFNLAATDYGQVVIDKVALARGIFPYVAVEVPSFPEQRAALLGSLEQLDAIGIDQLNLQELVVTPANIRKLSGTAYSIGDVTLLYGSRKLTYEVIRRCLAKGYCFTCVDCSAGVKNMMDQGSLLGY